MTVQEILYGIKRLSHDDALEIKNSIIDDCDKRRYSKEVLSKISKDDAIATMDWLRREYDV